LQNAISPTRSKVSRQLSKIIGDAQVRAIQQTGRISIHSANQEFIKTRGKAGRLADQKELTAIWSRYFTHPLSLSFDPCSGSFESVLKV